MFKDIIALSMYSVAAFLQLNAGPQNKSAIRLGIYIVTESLPCVEYCTPFSKIREKRRSRFLVVLHAGL